MPKYTEAFFNITHKPVTIMQIRNEYNLDHTVLAVWSHFTTDTQALLQAAQQPLHIAFLGSPSSLQTQKLKLSHMCYLRRSTFLQILEGWIA